MLLGTPGRTDFARAVADVGDVATSIRTKLVGLNASGTSVGYCWGGVVVTGVGFCNSTDRRCLGELLRHGHRELRGSTADGADDVSLRRPGPHNPNKDIAKMQAAWPTATIHVYGAQHGFKCDQRGSFDPASRDLTLTRTLEFFAAHVG